jgi:hypothetical protein
MLQELNEKAKQCFVGFENCTFPIAPVLHEGACVSTLMDFLPWPFKP